MKDADPEIRNLIPATDEGQVRSIAHRYDYRGGLNRATQHLTRSLLAGASKAKLVRDC